MGGRIAIEMAFTHAEQVDRLVLVSTSARVVPTWRRTFLFDVLHRIPPFRGRQPRYAFERQRDASGAYDGTARLAEIAAPTLILSGRRDRLAPPALAQELQRGIRGSELRMFRGGHGFFMLGDRKAFAGAVEECLRRQSRGRRLSVSRRHVSPSCGHRSAVARRLPGLYSRRAGCHAVLHVGWRHRGTNRPGRLAPPERNRQVVTARNVTPYAGMVTDA
jgi:hypothetical protein